MAVTLALLMVFLVITQYARLMITASGIKDAMEEAVISTVNDNYADVYHAIREGYQQVISQMGLALRKVFNMGMFMGDWMPCLDCSRTENITSKLQKTER